jgi:PhnB protein
MQVTPYLSFNGDCEAAFTFYAQCLGGELGALFRYGGTPLENQVPADYAAKVMHGSVTVGGHELAGGDVAPDAYAVPKGFSLSLQIDSVAEAERVFRELSQGGSVALPLAQTFWAARFGMLVDRFGIPWMINCDAPESGSAA